MSRITHKCWRVGPGRAEIQTIRGRPGWASEDGLPCGQAGRPSHFLHGGAGNEKDDWAGSLPGPQREGEPRLPWAGSPGRAGNRARGSPKGPLSCPARKRVRGGVLWGASVRDPKHWTCLLPGRCHPPRGYFLGGCFEKDPWSQLQELSKLPGRARRTLSKPNTQALEISPISMDT